MINMKIALTLIFLSIFCIKSVYASPCLDNSDTTADCTGPLTLNAIGNLYNDYTVTGDVNVVLGTELMGSYGIWNHRTIQGTINNLGVIIGTNGIYNDGSTGSVRILAVINSGKIGWDGTNNYSASGILNMATGVGHSATIDSITNNASHIITGSSSGYGIENIASTLGLASVLSITNSGAIGWNGGSYARGGIYNLGISGTAYIGSITNNLGGTVAGSSYGIRNSGGNATIGVITNGGAISGNIYAIQNTGSITTLTNGGAISTTGAQAIFNGGTIGTLTNTGSIAGHFGIYNDVGGSIPLLINGQGGDSSTPAKTALTYSGILPTNYNIIINDTTHFGQLSTSSVTGSLTFGLDTSSLLSANTYAGILTGLSSSNITNYNSIFDTWTNFNSSYKWELVSGIDATTWNLLVASLSTNIASGSGNYLADVGSSLNPTFAGGTLTLLNGDSSSQNFAVNSGGGTLTSPTTGSATLSGVFSGTGAMTFNGTGTTYMNGVNTYTGGTTVASGTLSVGSSEANNTARLAGDVTVQTAGTLAGHGGIGGNVTNSGTVAPGGSIGTLTVSGNYVQNANGTLSTSITPTANSVLAVTGTASLAGGFAIDASSGTYTKKTYTVLTSSGRSGQFSGISGNLASYSSLGSSLAYDANNVYLILSASSVDTQQSLANTSNELKGAFNLKTSIINNGLNYDCSLFDVHGLCISTGGRYSNTNTPTGDSTGALVIGGYRVNDHVRVGLYLDQGVSSSTPTGINLKQHNPLFGAFGVWEARQDGLGAQVKVAAGYNDSDMTVTRTVVGTSDAGSGSTSLINQAASVVGSYGVEMQGSWIAYPYAGVRYTNVKADGYTEATNSAVTAPLTYATLEQSAVSLLAGIRWSGKLTDRVSLNGSVGVEQDVDNSHANYIASSPVISGLNSIVFNTDINKTRPVASVGTTVSIDKRQQLAFSVIYREEAFSKSSSASAYGTYTIGF